MKLLRGYLQQCIKNSILFSFFWSFAYWVTVNVNVIVFRRSLNLLNLNMRYKVLSSWYKTAQKEMMCAKHQISSNLGSQLLLLPHLVARRRASLLLLSWMTTTCSSCYVFALPLTLTAWNLMEGHGLDSFHHLSLLKILLSFSDTSSFCLSFQSVP